MHLSFLPVLSILCILAFSPSAAAQTSVLRVPISSYPPWIITEPGSDVTAIDIDLLKSLCKRMNLKLELVSVPFTRGLLMLEQGELDAGTTLQRSADRELFLHFVEPHYHRGSDKAFYLLKRSPISIQRYEDLNGLRIGYITGTKYFARFDNDQHLNKIPAHNLHQLHKMLAQGRIDTFIHATSVADCELQKYGCAKHVRHAQYRFTEGSGAHLAISRGSPLIKRAEEFSRHIKAMVDSGEIDEIMSSYNCQYRHAGYVTIP